MVIPVPGVSDVIPGPGGSPQEASPSALVVSTLPAAAAPTQPPRIRIWPSISRRAVESRVNDPLVKPSPKPTCPSTNRFAPLTQRLLAMVKGPCLTCPMFPTLIGASALLVDLWLGPPAGASVPPA